QRDADAEPGAVRAWAVADGLAADVGPRREGDRHVGGELVARAVELEPGAEPAGAAPDALLLGLVRRLRGRGRRGAEEGVVPGLGEELEREPAPGGVEEHVVAPRAVHLLPDHADALAIGDEAGDRALAVGLEGARLVAGAD